MKEQAGQRFAKKTALRQLSMSEREADRLGSWAISRVFWPTFCPESSALGASRRSSRPPPAALLYRFDAQDAGTTTLSWTGFPFCC